MIETGKYYLINTLFGHRVTKAICRGTDGLTYGSISPSAYEHIDNCSTTIEGFVVREATEEEASEWDNWYNRPAEEG